MEPRPIRRRGREDDGLAAPHRDRDHDLTVGIFAYMLLGGLGGGSLAMVIAGILITILGFAKGRRDEDRAR